jgi:hypothetical protein
VNAKSLSAAALLLLAACASMTPEQAQAAKRATEQAQRDVARGRPRLAVVALLPEDASALDPDTGRVRYSIGCCSTPVLIAYRDAYNDVVRAAPGLHAMTLQRKAKTRAVVDAAFAEDGVKEIRLGGPGAEAPGGRFRVEVAPGTGRDAIALWCTDAAGKRRDELRYLGAGQARVTFGDDGTTLYVRDDAARATSTYDLPSALFLEVFPDPPRER